MHFKLTIPVWVYRFRQRTGAVRALVTTYNPFTISFLNVSNTFRASKGPYGLGIGTPPFASSLTFKWSCLSHPGSGWDPYDMKNTVSRVGRLRCSANCVTKNKFATVSSHTDPLFDVTHTGVKPQKYLTPAGKFAHKAEWRVTRLYGQTYVQVLKSV